MIFKDDHSNLSLIENDVKRKRNVLPVKGIRELILCDSPGPRLLLPSVF